MSTRAMLIIESPTKDEAPERFLVYRHWDGYPRDGEHGVLPDLQKVIDSDLVWELPRFEADEFACGLIATLKTQPGGYRLASFAPNGGVPDWGQDFTYRITAEGDKLKVTYEDYPHDDQGGNGEEKTEYLTRKDLIKPTKITLERLEGQAHECYPRAFTSYAAANAWLLQASQSAPRDGSYDKVKFTIEFPDGSRYNGRYDLGHHSVDPCNIQKHVLSALTWDAFHPDAQKVLSFTQIQTAREMLDRLDFGQAPQEVSNA